MELGAANVKLFRQMIPILARNNPRSIFIVITNPVDVLTYLVTQLSGFPSSKIVGVGTLVDSAQLELFADALSSLEFYLEEAYTLNI